MTNKEPFLYKFHKARGELHKEIADNANCLRKMNNDAANEALIGAIGVKVLALIAYYEFEYGEKYA